MRFLIVGLMAVYVLFALERTSVAQPNSIKTAEEDRQANILALEDRLAGVQTAIRTAHELGRKADALLLEKRAQVIARSLHALRKNPPVSSRSTNDQDSTESDRSEDVYVLIKSILTLNKIQKSEAAKLVSAVCKEFATPEEMNLAFKKLADEHNNVARDDSEPTAQTGETPKKNKQGPLRTKTKKNLENEVIVFKKAMETMSDSVEASDRNQAPILARAMRERSQIIFSKQDDFQWRIDPNETRTQIGILKRAAELMRNDGQTLHASITWELLESLEREIDSQAKSDAMATENPVENQANPAQLVPVDGDVVARLTAALQENEKARLTQRIMIRNLEIENKRLLKQLQNAGGKTNSNNK